MSKDRKDEFSVHCLLCGKNFYIDTKLVCGGTANGNPMCKTNDIEKAIKERIASVKGGPT